MNIWLISMIVVTLIIVGLAVFMAIRVRKRRETPNYRGWFYIGICWILLGIATKNPFFYIMSAAFVIIRLANKDKWREEKTWADLSPAEKKLKIILISVSVVLLITSVVFLSAIRLLFKIKMLPRIMQIIRFVTFDFYSCNSYIRVIRG
ncbi:MAG: hypothetical protein KGZ86_02720 [Candidatus Latescibacteria bacterium]|nr:hypothetical protein [Candidatus Latescibacterota bacterium]